MEGGGVLAWNIHAGNVDGSIEENTMPIMARPLTISRALNRFTVDDAATFCNFCS